MLLFGFTFELSNPPRPLASASRANIVSGKFCHNDGLTSASCEGSTLKIYKDTQMDPGTVIGAIDLGWTVVSHIRKLIIDWHDVPRHVEECEQEVKSITKTLDSTWAIIQSPEYRKAIGVSVETAEMEEDLLVYKTQLNGLLQRLSKENGNVFKKSWDRFQKSLGYRALRESIENLNSRCDQLQQRLGNDTSLTIANIKNDLEKDREQLIDWQLKTENIRIMTWISKSSFEEMHNQILHKREPGTGEWLLERDDFQCWRNRVTDSGGNLAVPLVYWGYGMRKSMNPQQVSLLSREVVGVVRSALYLNTFNQSICLGIVVSSGLTVLTSYILAGAGKSVIT